MRETKLYQLMNKLEKELQRIVEKNRGVIVSIEVTIKAQSKPTMPQTPC